MSTLKAALDDALVIARRDRRGGGIHLQHPSGEQLKKLRERLGLSQNEFADAYGFSVESLRKWEQGRARPEASSTMLIKMIDHDPETVARLVVDVALKENA